MGGVSWCLEERAPSADVAQGYVVFDGVVICAEGADSALKLQTDLVALHPVNF